MPTVLFAPQNIKIELGGGETILQALIRHGLAPHTPCGGRGTCGKCRIQIREGDAGQPTPTEHRRLGASKVADGYRLACQLVPSHDLVITWEDAAGFGAARLGAVGGEGAESRQILASGARRAFALDPAIRKVLVTVDAPTLADQRSDVARLQAALAAAESAATAEAAAAAGDGAKAKSEVKADFDANANSGFDHLVLTRAGKALRDGGFRVTAALRGRRVLALEPGDTRGASYGMAFDIGTTTVVGYLLDLTSGRELAVSSRYNPQAVHGADVVSRIAFADSEPAGAGTLALQSEVLGALRELTLRCVRDAGVDPEKVYEYTIAGNTCMHHLALGIDPATLASSPYVPTVSETVTVRAVELGLPGAPGAVVWFFPNIAGFVGGDTVAVGVAAALWRERRPTLAIDVGTNGEMVLSDGERLAACSTAAGPAFEGAAITHGMRAEDGAIDRVWLAPNGDIACHVIGEGEPRGICGSGMVDLVAALLDAGLVNSSGRIVAGSAGNGADGRSGASGANGVGSRLARRLIEVGEGQPAIALSDGGKVFFSQQDIRQLQLAKGALQAGYTILAMELGVSLENLSKVVLAGAFGNYLSPAAARRIGLLPPIALERVIPIGNGAGVGAQMALLSRAERENAGRFRDEVRYVELSARQDFFEVFSDCLVFPEVSATADAASRCLPATP